MDTKHEDLNNTYYTTLDENFNEALKLFEQNFTHKELIQLLKDGNIPQKQLAALQLEKIDSTEEASVLCANLVGQDGKIREAVSIKVNEFISNYFLTENIYKNLLSGIIDVNGNVCRNIISAVCKLKYNSNFCKYFCTELIKMIDELLPKINEFNEKDGKYKVNKELFKLYWCLETLYEFSDLIAVDDVKRIILQTKNCSEYTIREKTAKILSKDFNDKELKEIRTVLQQDKNYYVRRF